MKGLDPKYIEPILQPIKDIKDIETLNQRLKKELTNPKLSREEKIKVMRQVATQRRNISKLKKKGDAPTAITGMMSKDQGYEWETPKGI